MPRTQKQPIKTTPRLWVVRAERKGQDEAFNFREGLTSIHWNDTPDPRTHSRQELEVFFAAHPNSGSVYAAEQIDRFCHEMQVGDFIVTPRWNHGRRYEKVAVGVVTGDYNRLTHDPEPDPRQSRGVDWLATDLDSATLHEVTQKRLKRLQYRYTCRRIHDEGIIRDILTHAGAFRREDG